MKYATTFCRNMGTALLRKYSRTTIHPRHGIVLISAFFLFYACNSPLLLKSKSTLDGPAQATDIHIRSLPDTTPDTEVTDSLPMIENDCVGQIDFLLEDSRVAIDSQNYPLAHRLLTNALVLIDSQAVELEAKNVKTTLFTMIVDLYEEEMPSAYEDSTAEIVAVALFQRRLQKALDSLQIAPHDSLARTMVSCQKSTQYNLPVVYNDRVIKALRFFEQHKDATIMRWLGRASYYIPVMEALFADSGLPTDLAYLPLIESGFNPKAYSYAHASGIWQFISSTGRIYGLRKNFWVDERRDPLKATQAAISYLKNLHEEFNHWYLALAAYNCGEGGVRRAIRKAGSNDYWNLRLPKQTMHYVPKFISSLIVARNPDCFGYTIAIDSAWEFDTIFTNECLDLQSIEKGLALPQGTLKKMNPHIKQWCTPPDMKNILLYLPSGTKEKFRVYAANLPENEKVKWYRYRIRSGDNLSVIASQFNLSVRALKSVNNLKSNRIIAGKYIFIPIPARHSASTYLAANSGSVSQSEKKGNQSQPPAGYHEVQYRVRSGETLSEISEIFTVSVAQLCRWNNITNRHQLRVGTKLSIYVKDKKSAAATYAENKAVPSVPGLVKKYTVEKGDNLYTIGKRLHVSSSDLIRWNGKDPARPLIHPGEVIVYQPPQEKSQSGTEKLPGGSNNIITYRVRPGDNLWNIASVFNVHTSELIKINSLNKNSVIHAGDLLKIPDKGKDSDESDKGSVQVIYYEVKKGDNLWTIATRYGVPVKELFSRNRLTQANRLMPGDTLRIPYTEEL